jgi:hypothetical protein
MVLRNLVLKLNGNLLLLRSFLLLFLIQERDQVATVIHWKGL